MKEMKDWFCILTGVIALLSILTSWLTHVIVCINEELWGFLIAGAIFFPVGVVHGIGIWFGVW